jgi:two-component system CheB/CheR fusion protein
VAGIGASAGGLDAFKRFFAAMPPDSGIAFVLVPHLDPAHESFMVELLARHTRMPVVEAENDMPVEANHVYIIPPNKYMTIHGGVLRLTGPVERHTSQTSIDLFLRSLADDQQERSICIIFSGTGSHGTLGLKVVKAAGGMAMVQEPATAAYPRMPQSAIATGLADYVLPVEQMPEALLKYVQHAHVNGGTRIEAAPEAADHLTQVLALLRTRTKFDFRAYRKKMLMRRIERRMGLNNVGPSIRSAARTNSFFWRSCGVSMRCGVSAVAISHAISTNQRPPIPTNAAARAVNAAVSCNSYAPTA